MVMDPIIIQQIYKGLKSAAIDAGNVMMKYRGKVENRGKTRYEDSTAAGLAFTDIDVISQEIMLSRLYSIGANVMVNAEENTPLRKLFEGNISDVAVHIDPIDGTLSYLEGRGTFACGCAISIDGIFTHTIIYAPARGTLYSASPYSRGIALVSPDVSWDRFSKKTLFAKKVFSEKGLEALRSLGYDVIPDNYGAHVSSIDAILDDIAGVIHGFTNPHDMLVASAFARIFGKVPYGIDGMDVTSKDLVMRIENGLPIYERIPIVGYFSRKDKDKILPLMLDEALWDSKFLEKVKSVKK